jgi:hypothetical protein
MAKGKEVATKEESAVTEYDPAFDAYVDVGHEEVNQEDIATPFLNVLQKMSPQVDKENAAFVKGAEAGQFFHSVNESCFDGGDGVTVVAAHFQSRWIEWIPLNQGGGFVRQYDAGEVPAGGESEIQVTLPDGHECSLTHLHYLLLVDEELRAYDPLIFSVSSTGITPSRKWNGALTASVIPGKGRAPRFEKMWSLKSVYRSNDQGNWYSWKPSQVRRLQPSSSDFDMLLVQAAAEFQKMVRSDEIVVDHDKSRSTQASSDEASGDRVDSQGVKDDGKGDVF